MKIKNKLTILTILVLAIALLITYSCNAIKSPLTGGDTNTGKSTSYTGGKLSVKWGNPSGEEVEASATKKDIAKLKITLSGEQIEKLNNGKPVSKTIDKKEGGQEIGNIPVGKIAVKIEAIDKFDKVIGAFEKKDVNISANQITTIKANIKLVDEIVIDDKTVPIGGLDFEVTVEDGKTVIKDITTIPEGGYFLFKDKDTQDTKTYVSMLHLFAGFYTTAPSESSFKGTNKTVILGEWISNLSSFYNKQDKTKFAGDGLIDLKNGTKTWMPYIMIVSEGSESKSKPDFNLSATSSNPDVVQVRANTPCNGWLEVVAKKVGETTITITSTLESKTTSQKVKVVDTTNVGPTIPQGKLMFYKKTGNNQGAINVMYPDGHINEIKFSDIGEYIVNPGISPDGTKIAFRTKQNDLATMNDDGTGQKILFNALSASQGVSFSSNNSRIVFTSNYFTKGGNSDIVLLENGQIKRLTYDKNSALQATISPDGNRVAFASVRNSTDTKLTIDIFIVDANTGESQTTPVTPPSPKSKLCDVCGETISVDINSPCPVKTCPTPPSSKKACDVCGETVYVDANVSCPVQDCPEDKKDITDEEFKGGLPGGGSVTIQEGMLPRFFTIMAETSAIQLTRETNFSRYPCWSQDGTKIVYMTYLPTNTPTGSKLMGQICVINPDGTGRKVLTDKLNLTGDNTYPAWSPDGTKLAFINVNSNFHTVYLMNSDGTNLVKLFEHSDALLNLSWGK